MTNKTLILLSAVFLIGGSHLGAQNFDTSGTAGLTGQYLFRYVNHFNDGSGNITEACSLTGVMTFDGKGNYTLSNTQLYDSAGSTNAFCTTPSGGTYGVQSNGMAQLDNPLFPATLFGTFSKPVLSASSTEDYFVVPGTTSYSVNYFDLFIAVQAPQTPMSNATLTGAYTLGSLEFPNVQTAGNGLAHQAYFTLNADGNGNISPITLNGSAANISSTTQNVTGATYSLSGVQGGTLTIPNQSNSQFVSGTKTIYVSADGAFIIGGSTSGADMIFGFPAPSGASSALLNGTYLMSGFEADISSPFLDSFYGSINTNGNGTLLWHERYNDVVDEFTFDQTFHSTATLSSSGSFYDSEYTTLASASGNAIMLIGSGTEFSLNVGVRAAPYTPTSSIWIAPTGIINAANFTPITNAYAPGEPVNIYGSFGVGTAVATSLPLPTTLGGVQVLVNGQPAPVYYVSSGEISAIIPYEVAQDYFATFQVVVNGATTNSVTLYADESSPGIYSVNQSGIGPGSILHANGTAVSASSPATPGETVSMFMNGLGTVTPSVGNGAAGSSNPLSISDELNSNQLFLGLQDFVDAEAQVPIGFAGLAPGFAGLYQVNFTIPTRGLGNGQVYLDFATLEGENFMATIYLSGFSHNSGVTNLSVRHLAVLRAKVAGTAAAARRPTKIGATSKRSRRALPERTVIQ